MRDNNTVSAPPLWHLSLARALFYLFLTVIVIKTLFCVADIFYFAGQSDSAIQITAGKSDYSFTGLGGYYRMSYDFLALNGSKITNGRLFALSVSAAHLLFKWIPLLLMLNLGRKLLKNLNTSYTPFTGETTTYIKNIGILMICIGAISKLLIQVSINIINLHRFNFVNPYELSWILAGIFTLLLSDIFARGCCLQQESDETL